jgi:hypothetical protein
MMRHHSCRDSRHVGASDGSSVEWLDIGRRARRPRQNNAAPSRRECRSRMLSELSRRLYAHNIERLIQSNIVDLLVGVRESRI